jgi:Mrp family chromosome partitioning ATPase
MSGFVTFMKELSIGRARERNGQDADVAAARPRAADESADARGMSAPGDDAVRLASALRASMGKGQRIITFASTSSGGGAGEVAAQVAAAFAVADEGPLLLIDANPDEPYTSGELGAVRGRGLADLIEGAASADEVIQRSGIAVCRSFARALPAPIMPRC